MVCWCSLFSYDIIITLSFLYVVLVDEDDSPSGYNPQTMGLVRTKQIKNKKNKVLLCLFQAQEILIKFCGSYRIWRKELHSRQRAALMLLLVNRVINRFLNLTWKLFIFVYRSGLIP